MVERACFHMEMSLAHSRPESEVELWASLSTPIPNSPERSEDVKGSETHRDPLLVMICSDQSGMKPSSTHKWLLQRNRSCPLRCFAFPSCPPPLPRLWHATTYLLRRGEQGRGGRGVVGCHNQSPCWRDSFGQHRTQREKAGTRGAGKVCLLVLSPPAPARAGRGGKRQRTLPGSVLIFCRRATGRLLPPRIEHRPPLGKNECAVRRELWMQSCGTWPCAKAEPGLHRLWACLCGQNEGRWAAGCSQCGGPDGPVFS